MNTVVVTGAAGPAAERVVASLAACEGVDRVVVVSPRPDPEVRAAVRPGGAVVEVHVADVVAVDLERFLHEASALVHLGAAVDDLDPALLADGRIVDEASAVLARRPERPSTGSCWCRARPSTAPGRTTPCPSPRPRS